MAGDKGFEPLNAGTKIQCLTAWRIPRMNLLEDFIWKFNKIKFYF